MKKIKIAYLPFYTKLYDDGHPERRIPLVKFMNTLISMIESQGFEVVLPPTDVCRDGLCRIKPEFEAAAAKFNADPEIAAIVTQHIAYSPSLEAIDSLVSLKAPIVVFDTTPDYDFLSAAPYEERSNPNHGIHGVQEMCSMLKRRSIPFTIVAGHAFHSSVVSELCALCRAAEAARSFRHARIGLAGFRFEGMGDFLIDDDVMKKQIGAEVVHLEKEYIKKIQNSITDAEVDAELKSDAAKYNVLSKSYENYRLATKAGLAIRRWAEDEKLTALSINFLHVYDNGMLKMPFTEACKEMEMGRGYAGEGDTLTAGLVGALMSVYPMVSFAEMFCPDWEKNLIYLNHYGEMNTTLSKFRPVISDDHFVYDATGDTVVMGGCFRPGDAVFVNLVPLDAENGRFDLIIAPVRMTDDGSPVGAYANVVQGWVDPLMPVGDFLKKYSEAGGTHHSALVYNVSPAELEAFAKFMGFNPVIIK